MLVAGGRIAWIGAERPDIPAALVDTVDLQGARVVPGLIDCHAHLTGGGGEAGPETRVPPVDLSRFTSGGVTTVVGVLGTDDTIRTPAELVTTAQGLTALGMTAYCYTGGYHVPPATVTGSVRGDMVLIDRVIGVGEVAISDHRSSQPTQDELLRIAADAHVGGLMSNKAGIVHLHVGDGERGLSPVRDAIRSTELPPSVFHPSHVNRRKRLFEEACDLAREGITIDITAFPVGPDEDAWPADEALVRYLDAGLPADRVTVSSDAGGCLPVFDLVDAAGAYLDPAQLGAAVALQLRLPGGPDVQRMWVVTGAGFRSLSASAMAIGALPGVGPVRPAEALPAGTYTLEVTVAGNRRLQQSVVLRAGERQQERFVVPEFVIAATRRPHTERQQHRPSLRRRDRATRARRPSSISGTTRTGSSTTT